jgi:hypothetical protein
MIRKDEDKWSDPVIVSFSGRFTDMEPSLSANDLRLYFASNRPLDSYGNESKDFDIWFVERKDLTSDWEQPVSMGKPVNSEFNEFYPSVAVNNNLYLTSDRTGTTGKDDIFFCLWNAGKYTAPIPLNSSINTEGYEFNAFVAHDESFIIFSGYNRDDGYGSGDLYISFQDDNKNWKPAVNLGMDINSRYMDYCPFFDTKSGILYFTSRRSALQEIKNFQSIIELEKEINQYENGESRIYRIVFTDQLSSLKLIH